MDQLVDRVAGDAAGRPDDAERREELRERDRGAARGICADALDGGGEQRARLGQHRYGVRSAAEHELLPRLPEDTRIVQRDCRLAVRRAVERHGDVRREHPQLEVGGGAEPAEPVADAQTRAQVTARVDATGRVIREERQQRVAADRHGPGRGRRDDEADAGADAGRLGQRRRGPEAGALG